MKTTRFILVRHGESTWNAAGRWQGHGDPPLSERGRLQARRCGEAFEGRSADLLVCSDLRRTRETAEPIAQALELTAVPNPRLRELELGRWTGHTREQIQATDADLLAEFDSGDPAVRAGGGESRRDIDERVRQEVETLAAAHPGKRIVLVVHAGVIRALIPGATPDNGEIFDTDIDAIRAAGSTKAARGDIVL